MERVDYESLIIQDLLNFQGDGSLQINPWYQRRSVWSTPQKAYLINTIFEKKPVPSIYIRHQIDLDNEKSIKEVVDGQQRIRTILSYKADEFPARHPQHRRKISYSDLSRAEKQNFLSTALSVGYLIGAEDSDVIEIFGRINSIAKTLNPQEKRNAKFSGDFKQLSLQKASQLLPFWRNTGIFTAAEISRMQEVQFISDLIINFMEGLTDFSARKIDSYYQRYDEDFPDAEGISARLDAVFQKLAAIDAGSIGDTIFQQYQIAFSLMVVMDQLRDAKITTEKVVQVIAATDRDVNGFKDLDVLSEEQSRILEAFTGGNLHRIRTRQVRHEMLLAAFA